MVPKSTYVTLTGFYIWIFVKDCRYIFRLR